MCNSVECRANACRSCSCFHAILINLILQHINLEVKDEATQKEVGGLPAPVLRDLVVTPQVFHIQTGRDPTYKLQEKRGWTEWNRKRMLSVSLKKFHFYLNPKIHLLQFKLSAFSQKILLFLNRSSFSSVQILFLHFF